jgi:predicted PurR-regulated permease PerM
MPQSKLVRIVLLLAIIALSMYIAERLWMFGASLGSLVSIIAVSWLLGLIVRPVIVYLRGGLAPPPLVRWVSRRYGETAAQRVGSLRLPFGVAVALVYLALFAIIAGGITLATASLLPQTIDLVNRLPALATELPATLNATWLDVARRLNINPNTVNLDQFVAPQQLSTQVAQIATALGASAVNIAAAAAGAIGQVLLVLILSLYVVVEDKLITRQFYEVLPLRHHERARAITAAIDRAFSGYLRSQFVSAVIHGAAALVVFTLFGLPFTLLMTLLAALLSVIPLIGSPLAIVIAGVIAFIVNPALVLPVTLTLLIADQIVAYVVVPRMLTESVGVPSLIALLSISVGVQLLGFWGLVFSVPIVGSIYAVIFDVWLPRRKAASGSA